MTITIFLKQVLLGNLWNTALICVMLGVKWLLRNRLSLRFQYDSWYVLLASLFLSFFPGGILRSWIPANTAKRQAFTISSTPGNSSNIATLGNGWLNDTTVLSRTSDAYRIAFIILIIWITGILVLIGVYWCGNHRLRMITQSALKPSRYIQEHFEICRRKLDISKRIELRQSRFLTSPISFGWRQPYVILPFYGVENLSETELDHILLHELMHIKHGDLFTINLYCGVQSLFWFNPMIWFALRQMRREREAYCDWDVMNGMRDESERISYGQTILNFAATPNMRLYTANGLCGGKEHLKYRLEQVIGFQRETSWQRFLGRCCAVLLALASIGQLPLLAFCADNSEMYYTPSDALTMEEANWNSHFQAKDGCAVVYDLNADRYTVYNKAETVHRVPPCSTYKIYSALNALELGTITPEDNIISWDGTANVFPAWDQNQTLNSAMHESVNWYFQRLDQEAGVAQIEHFFKEIGYGDCNLDDNLENLWNGSGVKISALEQVQLLQRFYQNSRGFDPANVSAVKNAMALSEKGLFGKTGTGRLDDTNIAGWFIGFKELSDNTYFIAVYLTSQDGADGALAYEIARNILRDMNIIK